MNEIINFLSYLQSFRSVGGGATTQDHLEFSEIGLKLSLITAREFLPSLQNFARKIGLNLIKCEKMDASLPLTKAGEVFNSNKSDKSSRHRYDLVYQPIFENLGFDSSSNILEIGLGTNNSSFVSHMGAEARPGASLFAYKELFPNAQIYGADVDENILFQEERIKTGYVDQLKFETFQTMHNNFNNPQYDILIEDGLHSITASLNTLIFGLEAVKDGGYIILEDLYNCHDVWNFIATLLHNSKIVESVKMFDSDGLMLVAKKSYRL